MVRYNVVAEHSAFRPGGPDTYKMRVNRDPLTLEEAEAEIARIEETGRAAELEVIA